MAQTRARGTTPRAQRIWTYTVEVRVLKPGIADPFYFKCGVVETSPERAVEEGRRQLQASPDADVYITSAGELNPAEAREWLAWHRTIEAEQGGLEAVA